MGSALPAAARVALLVCATLTIGCSRGESGIIIGYGDFVRFGGITYDAIHPEVAGDTAEKVVRSSPYARTRVRLQGGDIVRPGGRFRDGDAGQREPGTPVYRLEGYDPEFRLAARFDGGWTVYEVASNPGAATGEDLMDVRGEVVRVDVYESDASSRSSQGPRFIAGTTRRGSVDDPEEVASLVDQLLRAPVERFPATFVGDAYVVLRLRDGTASAGAYDPDSGRLSSTIGGTPQGVVAPPEIRAHIGAPSGKEVAEGGASTADDQLPPA